ACGRPIRSIDVERCLHDQFRFRPRRQHVARDLEVQAPELAVADDLRDGLPPDPARDEPIELFLETRGRRLPARERVLRQIPLQRMPREDFGVSGGFVGRNTGGQERLARLRHPAGEIDHAEVSAAVASLSFSEVKWVMAASISSPRSPSSAASSWCIVNGMRWSVTRFSLKL